MKYELAYMIRHIFQNHIGPTLQPERGADGRWTHRLRYRELQELLDLEDEEMQALTDFANDVACHVLERLVDDYPPSPAIAPEGTSSNDYVLAPGREAWIEVGTYIVHLKHVADNCLEVDVSSVYLMEDADQTKLMAHSA